MNAGSSHSDVSHLKNHGDRAPVPPSGDKSRWYYY